MGPVWVCDLCYEHSQDCMWPPSTTGHTKACTACTTGKVQCVVGPPKARPLKCDLEPEESGPSGKHAKMGDVVIIESDSKLEWALLQEDLWLHALEYLSMQMRDQTLLMERGMWATEVITQMVVSAVSFMWEQ